MFIVRRLGLIVTVMLALTAVYFLVTTAFKPSQPQVIVVKPSGGAQGTQTQTPSPPPPPPPTESPPSGPPMCVRMFYLKVGSVSICADMIYSVAKTNDHIQVDFQGGMVQGQFMFVSPPNCVVSTTPQGVFIPCRAQIMIPLKQ